MSTMQRDLTGTARKNCSDMLQLDSCRHLLRCMRRTLGWNNFRHEEIDIRQHVSLYVEFCFLPQVVVKFANVRFDKFKVSFPIKFVLSRLYAFWVDPVAEIEFWWTRE